MAELLAPVLVLLAGPALEERQFEARVREVLYTKGSDRGNALPTAAQGKMASASTNCVNGVQVPAGLPECRAILLFAMLRGPGR